MTPGAPPAPAARGRRPADRAGGERVRERHRERPDSGAVAVPDDLIVEVAVHERQALPAGDRAEDLGHEAVEVVTGRADVEPERLQHGQRGDLLRRHRVVDDRDASGATTGLLMAETQANADERPRWAPPMTIASPMTTISSCTSAPGCWRAVARRRLRSPRPSSRCLAMTSSTRSALNSSGTCHGRVESPVGHADLPAQRPAVDRSGTPRAHAAPCRTATS